MSTPMLAWYPRASLDGAAAHLRLDPVLEIAADLTFRDADGTWWRPQQDGSWVHHRDGIWSRAEVPAMLEGTAPLPIGIARSVLDDAEPDGPAQARDPATALEHAVDQIQTRYRSGAMVSTMAELLLTDRKVISDDGNLWTVGARSRSWYRYTDRGWVAGTRPAGPFLHGDEARTAAESEDSLVRRWAEQGPYLPEAITPGWTPPPAPAAPVSASSPPAPSLAPPPPPPPPPASPRWTASHQVPAHGMQAWPAPDPTASAASDLMSGTRLEMIEVRGDWAHVRAANGWEGWVDGRRLVALAAPQAPEPTTTRQAAAVRPRPLQVVATIVFMFTVLLPWHSGRSFYDETMPFDAPVKFLWDFHADGGDFALGMMIFLIGVALLAGLLVGPLRQYRSVAAWLGFGMAALWLVQTFRLELYWEQDATEALINVFTVEFALGPWIALVAAALLTRRTRASIPETP